MDFVCLICLARYPAHTSWCLACFEAGYVVMRPTRAVAAIDSIPEITDARALSASSWGRVDVAAFPDLQLGPGALVVVHGAPGAGKSTWTARALDTMSGAVLLSSQEEPPGPTLASRLSRAAVKRSDFVVIGRSTIDQIAQIAQARKVVGMAIDSVQVGLFSPRDLRHLLAILPDLQVLIGIAQENKLGTVAGKNELLHEADVVIDVADGQWRLEKSRYQEASEKTFSVLNKREMDHVAVAG